MNTPYRTDPPSTEVLELAEKITALVIDSAVTYRVAMDALRETETMLAQKTKPVNIQS